MSQSTQAPRMLVLDDDVDIGTLVGELGQRCGFDAVVTHDAEHFNEELGREAPDLVVLDLQMPRTDGIEILRELAASGVRANILLVSGMDKRTIASAENFGRQAELNVIGTVQKPFTPEEMLEQLSTAGEAAQRLTSNDLAGAIENGELTLRYQPIVHRIRAGVWHAESVETLVRWQHPTLGILVPSQFLSLIDSDRGELMKQLTDFVFERGIQQLQVWQNSGYQIGLRVNVAAGLIADAHFPDRLAVLLEEHDTDPQLLTIEIRDATALGQSTKGSDILTRLRLKSINLSLDDFGAGGSALDSLYKLPFGELKIDRSLVADIATADGAATLAGGLIEVAHRLEMSCCAVGVETARQLEVLDGMHCDRAQGFYISGPVGAAELPEVLRGWTATLGQDAASA